MSEYQQDVYVFFESHNKFNRLIKDQPGPWYFCDIIALATFRDGRVRTIGADTFILAKWWMEHKTNKSTVFYQASEGIIKTGLVNKYYQMTLKILDCGKVLVYF